MQENNKITAENRTLLKLFGIAGIALCASAGYFKDDLVHTAKDVKDGYHAKVAEVNNAIKPANFYRMFP